VDLYFANPWPSVASCGRPDTLSPPHRRVTSLSCKYFGKAYDAYMDKAPDFPHTRSSSCQILLLPLRRRYPDCAKSSRLREAKPATRDLITYSEPLEVPTDLKGPLLKLLYRARSSLLAFPVESPYAGKLVFAFPC